MLVVDTDVHIMYIYMCNYVFVCFLVDEYILSMEKNLEVLVRENDSLKPDEVEKLGKKAYDMYPTPD